MTKLTLESLLNLLTPRTSPSPSATVGVLAFELAAVMSRLLRLHQSLSSPLPPHPDGVLRLVSDNPAFLLSLALAESLDSLSSLAQAVSLLARSRCSDPFLRRLDLAVVDYLRGGGTVGVEFEFGAREMERKVRKMERLVSATVSLYQEMEVVAELELGLRRMESGSGVDRSVLLEFRQKVVWQRQEVKCLKEASLWNRTFDYVVRLLARSLFTLIRRIRLVYGVSCGESSRQGNKVLQKAFRRSHSMAVGHVNGAIYPANCRNSAFPEDPRLRARSGRILKSGPLPSTNEAASDRPQGWSPLRVVRNSILKSRWTVPRGPFKGCTAVGDVANPLVQSCAAAEGNNGVRRSCDGSRNTVVENKFVVDIFSKDLAASIFGPQRKLLVAPASTLGAAALALHYANVIVVIEKLAVAPHLIGPEARDDLYSMLPASIRSELRAKLKEYASNLSASVYDPGLASEWNDAIARILEWLAPLAHNMIRWQSERNYEQQHLFSKTNVLLLQTLYFADKVKTEAVIAELLVGLNYLWRFERELHAKAMLETSSGKSFDDQLDSKE